VRAAREIVREPFAVINADDFYGTDAYRVASDYFIRTPASSSGVQHYAMVGYALDHTLSDHGVVNRGICKLRDGADPALLRNVEEVLEIRRSGDDSIIGRGVDGMPHELAGDSIVSMNFWAFTPSFFGQLEEKFTAFLQRSGGELKSECYIPTVVDALIGEQTADCRVLQTTASWFGVTYPEDKDFVVSSIAKLIELGEYPSPLV
jgi:hypothetical protein